MHKNFLGDVPINKINYKFVNIVIYASLIILSCNVNSDNNDKDNGNDEPEISLISSRLINIDEPSGLTYNNHKNELYVVTDKPHSKIYTIDTTGIVLDSMDYVGNDLEAIIYNQTDSTIWVSEESLLQLVNIDLNGREINRIDIDFLPNTIQNSEIEGLTISYSDSCIYLLNEKNPGAIIELDITSMRINNIYYLDFSTDYSGLHYTKEEKMFIILSDEDKSVSFWKKETGLINSIDLSYTKAEGVSLVNNILFIVSEQGNMMHKYSIKF